MFDDVMAFLANVNGSVEYGEDLVSEPTLDNYSKYQDEKYHQGLELARFKRRHSRDLMMV